MKRAEENQVTTLIHKRDEHALLAPLDRFPAAREVDAFPSHGLSAAQKDFGVLITQAAQGQPQVLRRGRTPVAVLLPVDTGTLAHSANPAADPASARGAVSGQGDQGRGHAPRRIATFGDALGSMLASGPTGGPIFGLPGLDAATGGLQPGRLTLVAAAPSVGGSLLGLAAARQTALVDGQRVLYAASGPNQADITRRIISAQTGGDYSRLKQGRLTEQELRLAQELRQVPLSIDDGSELTAEAIAETAPYFPDLALVVVDRLQSTGNPRLPLSGDRLPSASQILATLARDLHIPVLAVVDSADPALLGLLDSDILLTLTTTETPSKFKVTVAERDFGTIGTAYLRPDLLHARFLDTGPADSAPDSRTMTVPEQPPAARPTDEHTPDDDTETEVQLQPGDEEDEPDSAPFPALKLLKDAVGRSKMHPIRVIRTEERDRGPWPLITEHMDGEPRWIHPDVTSTRVPHIRENGKRVRRDKIDVPETFGTGTLCLIDRNGSYPSACSAVPLAPNKLLHTGPLEAFDKASAGIYLIDIPQWTRTDMPHPLGRIIDRPDEHGRVWVTTPHIKQLVNLVRDDHLHAMPTIHDSWTGKANESLFKPFYEASRTARTELVQTGGDPYKAYKTRLSIALRLLWPKREEQRSPFWRPDWRMSMVAEASVRHWTVAFRAVQEGHTLLALRNVDQAIYWTPPDTPPSTYRIGTGFGEVKSKFVEAGETILEGDD
ncbi:ATP-binding protein [Streptomyces albus]|uniref:ATP-binding protein n=1 Tax=Streptomyces albus (strain ATCC 21838 / DSM 41398 / FERM P-419 / JCM 4703 / NBRC 107858) TaxID=1081613 RepID=A0A0B5ENJ5_STRA4|nr:ATP-binding protein [Streptomyces albus]